jgi:Uma2 family endonuclease
MGMPAPLYYTADMVRALPEDGNRYEVVHGELLVTPAPRALHQRVQMRLIRRIDAYLARNPVGELFASPADLSWGDDILVQPDLFVVRRDEASTLDWAQMKHLLLAIEVLSPSSGRADRFTKRRLYQEVGVPLYWMVDADERVVEVWTPDATFPVFERSHLAWHPEGAPDPLTIPCADLFRPE